MHAAGASQRKSWRTLQQRCDGVGYSDSQCAGRGAQQQIFNDQPASQPETARSQRGAKPNLPLPLGGARQLQVGDVDARNQQQ